MTVHEDKDSGGQGPVLSIVVVNSDGMELTLNCLDSLYQNPPNVSFEIILVDNHSKEPCLPVIFQSYPGIRGLMAPQRQGFAKNYNLGIRHAKGQYVLILNNDTVVHPGALDAMMQALLANHDYGMVGPKLIGKDQRIQPVCARPLLTPFSFILGQLFLDPGMPLGQWWQRIQSRKLEHRSSSPVPCISGACMLLPTSVLQQIGLLDEGYEFYFEDVEWCHRMEKRGFKVGFVAMSRITHLGDQSLSKVREWAKKGEYLSALRYFRQYYALTFQKAKALWLATVVNFWLRRLAFQLRRDPERAQVYNRLLEWILQNPPAKMDYGTS